MTEQWEIYVLPRPIPLRDREPWYTAPFWKQGQRFLRLVCLYEWVNYLWYSTFYVYKRMQMPNGVAHQRLVKYRWMRWMDHWHRGPGEYLWWALKCLSPKAVVE